MNRITENQRKRILGAEWQRAEAERWEQLEMEIGVERNVVLNTPKTRLRIITAKVRNMGRASAPKHLFDELEK